MRILQFWSHSNLGCFSVTPQNYRLLEDKNSCDPPALPKKETFTQETTCIQLSTVLRSTHTVDTVV